MSKTLFDDDCNYLLSIYILNGCACINTVIKLYNMASIIRLLIYLLKLHFLKLLVIYQWTTG